MRKPVLGFIGELIGYPWSGVRRRRPSTISNVFSSETAWPIKDKFHVEPHEEGETKVCINGPFKKSSSPEPAKRFPRNLV